MSDLEFEQRQEQRHHIELLAARTLNGSYEIEIVELKRELEATRKTIEEARKELEMISPVSSKVRPLFEHVKNALDILNQ